MALPGTREAHVARDLAARRPEPILERNSDAVNPEARCRAGRPCLEGSKSRDRLSERLAWPAFLAVSGGPTKASVGARGSTHANIDQADHHRARGRGRCLSG